MKSLYSLLLVSFFSFASGSITPIKCPEYDEKTALKREPNKKYFRDTVSARVESKEASDAEVLSFI